MKNSVPSIKRDRFAIVPGELFTLRLKDGSRLDAVDFAVFTAIVTFANADRYAYPAVDTLAEMVNRKRRNTIDHLRRLEEAGAITSIPRYDEHGRQTSNGYVLVLMKSALRDAAKRTPENAADCTGEDAADCTQTGPQISEPQEQKVLGAAGAPPTKNDLVLLENDQSTVMSSGRRMTFRQANESGDLKRQCIGLAVRKFADHDWPDIEWDLLWEEFSHFWGVESPRRTKKDWPTTFYNRAMERRSFSAYRKGDNHARRKHTGNATFLEVAGDKIRRLDADDATGCNGTHACSDRPRW